MSTFESSTGGNGRDDNVDMASVVAQATQICNAMFIAIREVNCYLKPKLAEIGILLDKRSTHALAMSCWIAMGQGKMHLRLPAKRFGKRVGTQRKESLRPVDSEPSEPAERLSIFDSDPSISPVPVKPAAKELFTRPEPVVPFSDPAVSPALKQLRELLGRDKVSELELMRVLRESAPRQTFSLASFEQIPDKTAAICLERWPVILELIESMRGGVV